MDGRGDRFCAKMNVDQVRNATENSNLPLSRDVRVKGVVHGQMACGLR